LTDGIDYRLFGCSVRYCWSYLSLDKKTATLPADIVSRSYVVNLSRWQVTADTHSSRVVLRRLANVGGGRCVARRAAMLLDFLRRQSSVGRRGGGLWQWRRSSLNDGRAVASVRNARCQSISGGDVRRRANNAVIWPPSIIFSAMQPSVRPSDPGGKGRRPAAVGGTRLSAARPQWISQVGRVSARPFHAYCSPTRRLVWRPCFRQLVNYSSDVFSLLPAHGGTATRAACPAAVFVCYLRGAHWQCILNVCLGYHSLLPSELILCCSEFRSWWFDVSDSKSFIIALLTLCVGKRSERLWCMTIDIDVDLCIYRSYSNLSDVLNVSKLGTSI